MKLTDMPGVFLELVTPDLSADEDVNFLFGQAVVLLHRECGCSIAEAEHLAGDYYQKFTSTDYCHTIGVSVQSEERLLQAGPRETALRIYYHHLKLDPSESAFIEWRSSLRSKF